MVRILTFNGKHFNAQVTSFTDTILNIFKNYVPNKYITIKDRDPFDSSKTKICRFQRSWNSQNNKSIKHKQSAWLWWYAH